ncbi:hypothetical protein RUM44_008082 [Polyplax serrata]|uniref:Uncharacterized protein n=1 Tax=Polyplax serrata TaxID=468196 RepID=A0ABR1BBQ8_POLSC
MVVEPKERQEGRKEGRKERKRPVKGFGLRFLTLEAVHPAWPLECGQPGRLIARPTLPTHTSMNTNTNTNTKNAGFEELNDKVAHNDGSSNTLLANLFSRSLSWNGYQYNQERIPEGLTEARIAAKPRL